MSRILTASPVPDETAVLGPDPTKDYEVQFWLLVDELEALGTEYRKVREKLKADPATLPEKLRTLEAQLSDPELVARHPESAKQAAQRRDRWRNGLDSLAHIESTARNARGWLAHCWQQMPQRRRKELQEAPDFPRAHMPQQIAGQVWTMAKAGREVPGRCPFALIGAVATMVMGVI